MSSTQITIAMAMEALDTLLFHFTDKKLQIAVNRFEFDETEIGQHFNIIRYEVPQTVFHNPTVGSTLLHH